MKVLLDENLPHQLRHELPGHDVFTTFFMNWSGIENGELLAVAAKSGFAVLLTNDRGLEYEQNPAELPIAVIILEVRSNTLEAIRPLLPRLLAVIGSVGRGQLVKLSGA